jgi:4-amino-4-deoxy-L-arabinose transferase-like glycosyltransferase
MLSTERSRLGLVLAVWLLTVAAGLGSTPLWEPDEPRFAEATRQMFARGDFITPWFNGQPRFEKPPLLYWLQAPFVAVLGPTEAAFRLPSALAALLTFVVVYRIGRLASPRAGLIAALSLATTFRFIIYARQGLTDLPVTAMVALAIGLFLHALLREDGHRRFALAGWAATGAAVLLKGPVAVFGPLVIVLFGLLAGPRQWWRRLELPLGILVAAGIALPWYLVMIGLHGDAFLDVAIRYEVVARYLEPEFPGRDRGPFFFAEAWLGDAAPWSFFFIGGLVWAMTRWRSLAEPTRQAVLLALTWFLAVLGLFSISSYKLPHYILPAYPAAALLVGVFLDAALDGRVARTILYRLPLALTALLFAVGAVLVGLLLRRAFGLPLADPSSLLPVVLGVGSMAIAALLIARRDRGALHVLIGTLVAGFAWTSLIILPNELRRFQPMPELARTVAARVPSSDPLAVSGAYRATSLVFYARRRIEVLEDAAAIRNYLMAPGTRYCVLPADDFAAIRRDLPRAVEIVDSRAIFNVRLRRLLERDPTRYGGTSLVLVRAD